MPKKKMTEFKVKDYGTLLASDKIDASMGVLFGGAGEGKIPPNMHNRTILIGLGGTGVRTINHIKRTINRKLDPSWKQYIAFLAIDSDENEVDQATDLTRAEAIKTTLEGVSWRAAREQEYPMPWRVFADAQKVEHLQAIDGNGCGRTRLMGKMKIHDKMAGDKGVDEKIVDMLSSTKAQLSNTSGNAFYEVYVIGSVCGGTCSGGFLEIPALVHRALNVKNIRMHAMLYLPDTVSELDSAWKSELEANGYASLKELNYYQGLSMRKGYREEWYFNSPAERKLTINADQDFFEMPYLVGTTSGAAKDSLSIAMDTIANFFVSILGDIKTAGTNMFLMDSFLNNAAQHRNEKHRSAGNPELEDPNQLHEFPKRFGAIGFATAAAPEEIIRAYAVSRACSAAGLKSVDADTKAAMISKGVTMLPFLGEKEFLPAGEGTEKAYGLLKPLLDFLKEYQQENFNFLQYMGLQNVTWEDLNGNVYESVNARLDKYIESKTNEAAKADLDNKLLNALNKFKAGIQEFVVTYGPLAFYNLYEGSFIPENNDAGIGLKRMLANICADKDPKNGVAQIRKSASDAEQEVQEAKRKAGELSKFSRFIDIGGKKQDLVNAWLDAKNAWVRISVNEKRREYVLGTYHAFDKKVVQPVGILAEELKAFGHILDKLSDAYQTHGNKLDDYDEFRKISDFATEVNIAALNTSAHTWLKEEAEQISAKIQGNKVRTALVDSFFENPDQWLEIPEGMVEITESAVLLANADVAVPARQAFDQCMRKTINLDLDVSIEKLFEQVSLRNVDYHQYAQQVMNALSLQSKPLFNGTIDNNLVYRYVMYPRVLDSSKPEIVNALKDAAHGLIEENNFYASAYADSVAMYQLVAPFEIYKLHDLEKWEQQYNEKMSRYSGLHGRSPDLKQRIDDLGTVSFEELTSWYDYPSITFKKDPTKKDPQTGERCHEGDTRLKIDALLEKARKLGVLYSKKDANNKWSFYRVYCDKSRDWEFDETLMRPDKETGLLPTGAKLVEAVAAQNESSIDEISRCVELHTGGLLNEPHNTEDWAWTYAKRVLYVHRPMLIEIRDTIDKFVKWNEQIEEYNIRVRAKWLPAKMIRMMQGHVFFCDEEGFWSLEDSDNVVANLSEAGINKLGRRNPKEAALVENGFVLFYLYNVLLRRKDVNEGGIDAMLNQAKETIEAYEDEAMLDACFDRVDKMLAEETAKLKALGGNLEDLTKKPLQKYVEKMDELGLKDYVSSICEFYAYARLWKRV